jgi:hypothetical protein
MINELTDEDLDRIGKRWLERIAQAEEREKDWRDTAEKAEAAYLCDEKSEDLPDFNILHSNVETIVPSIYNSTPRPEIRVRHQNRRKDPVAKVVSDILELAIAMQIDDNALDCEVEKGAQDAFMAGRDVVRIRFDADEEEIPAQMGVEEVVNPETGEIELAEVEVQPAITRITNERIIYENVSWRDYREGPAKRWRDVPWVCYRHEVSEAERERLEEPGLAVKQADKDAPIDEDRDCTVWEIWDKETRKVFFVVEESGKVLSIKDDPLGLKGFFPQPEPVQPVTGTGKRTPVCPYSAYKKLAQELSTITRRINGIMKGIKVRGLIGIAAEAVEDLAQAGDNELVAAADLEGIGAIGGLDKAILWWPIEQAVNVVRELYVQREQTKQAIYEITGISDIIRGQGAASETATAQQIKTEWGSLRIKKMQRLIERQVRDLFVLSAEVISRHFSYASLQKMTGIEIDEQAAQMLQTALDHYRIDVESDSTIRADQTKSREEMSRFLDGTATFFSTMAPIVAQSPATAAPLVKMYAAFAQQFSLGRSAEDALDELVQMAEQEAENPRPNPGEEMAKAEMEMKQQEAQAKIQEVQGKMALEVEKLKLQAQNLGLDGQIKRAELALKQRELGLKEATGELDAAKAFVETGMEREQERPVKIGN